jgi:hypothetical protein
LPRSLRRASRRRHACADPPDLPAVFLNLGACAIVLAGRVLPRPTLLEANSQP